MTSNAAPAAFELKDEDYWKDPGVAVMGLIGKLARAKFDGVLLGAPKVVPLKDRETFPVAALRAGTCQQTYDVNIDEHAMVVAMDLRANRLLVASANDDDDLDRPGPDDVDEGYTADLHMLDLRELLGLPWKPARYQVWVLLRERLSQRVDVELSRGGFQDEEVERFLEEQRRLARAPLAISPRPGDPYPSYVADEHSPALPAETGIELSTQRIVVVKDGARCVVRGAFRLPIPSHEQYVPPEEGEPYDPAPSAVVRVTLLVVGADDGLAVLEVQCPTYAPVQEREGQLYAEGHFALDLLGRLGRTAQTYFVYAFSREIQAGPALTALVSEDMLLP
jgi:hypothetical protein